MKVKVGDVVMTSKRIYFGCYFDKGIVGRVVTLYTEWAEIDIFFSPINKPPSKGIWSIPLEVLEKCSNCEACYLRFKCFTNGY